MPEYVPYSPPYLEEEENKRISEYLTIELNKISGEFFLVPQVTISGMSSNTPDDAGRVINTVSEKITKFDTDYNLGLRGIYASSETDKITLSLGNKQIVIEMVFTIEFKCAAKTAYTFTLYSNGSPTDTKLNVGTGNGQDYASNSVTKVFNVAGDTELEIYVNSDSGKSAFEIQSIDVYLKLLKI